MPRTQKKQNSQVENLAARKSFARPLDVAGACAAPAAAEAAGAPRCGAGEEAVLAHYNARRRVVDFSGSGYYLGRRAVAKR